MQQGGGRGIGNPSRSDILFDRVASREDIVVQFHLCLFLLLHPVTTPAGRRTRTRATGPTTECSPSAPSSAGTTRRGDSSSTTSGTPTRLSTRAGWTSGRRPPGSPTSSWTS